MGKNQDTGLWEEQNEPVKNEYPFVWDIVVEELKRSSPTNPNQKMALDFFLIDIHRRDQTGLKKYGTRLQPFNGRNATQDAYEEQTDAVVYLRSAIFEHDVKHLIQTQESSFIKQGLISAYHASIDTALKLKYILLIDKEKRDNEFTVEPIDYRGPEELRVDKPIIVVP